MTTTLNWCYGAKTPDIAIAVENALHLAHKYRNKLCELEIEKRNRHYSLLREHVPEFVAIEEKVACVESVLADHRQQLQSEKARQRTNRPVGVNGITDAIRNTKDELIKIRAQLKSTKLIAYKNPRVIAAMDQNTACHKSETKIAKDNCGLYWGTSAVVTEACRSFSVGAPPEFRRFTGEGQLGVQIQNGLDCQDAERSNTLFYIGQSLGKKLRECFIRVDSTEKGKPIFARVPIVFHRPLPEGRIKWAYLQRRKIADHVFWTIRITVNVRAENNETLPGEVAVHTGWRTEDAGLRVATWLGSDGRRGVVHLVHVEEYTRLDEIQSQRDTRFNETRKELKEWLVDREVPEWLEEIKSHLHCWKSKRRLASLVLHWRGNRFEGDDIFDRLSIWRRNDKHAWQNESRLSIRLSRRRKDLYRNLAADLASKYGVVTLAKIDAKKLTENSQPEELKFDNTRSHRLAKIAAISELSSLVAEKFPLHSIIVDAKNITKQCCKCGCINEVEGWKVQCRECGITYDVDSNAVSNIFARGQMAMNDGAMQKLAESQENKEKAAKAKLANLQASRKKTQKQ